MKATEFDERFDTGEDVSSHVDWKKSRHINIEAKRMHVDFPAWVVSALDRHAQKLGITRQALIKILIAERLE